MDLQQQSALSSTTVVGSVPITRQELLDIRAGLAKWTETCPPEESTDFAQRALLMFKFNGGTVPY
jgi:hypothetical protein